MSKTHFFTLGFIALILLLAAIGTFLYVSSVKDAPNSEAKKDLATNTGQQFIDLSGKQTDLSLYKGQVRVVYLWASWSPFSKNELGTLDQIATDYANKNVVVIAMNRKESKEDAERFLKTLNTFTHLIFAIDVNDTFYKSIGGYAMPELVIYDSKGNLVQHYRGEVQAAQIRTDLEKLASTKQ